MAVLCCFRSKHKCSVDGREKRVGMEWTTKLPDVFSVDGTHQIINVNRLIIDIIYHSITDENAGRKMEM